MDRPILEYIFILSLDLQQTILYMYIYMYKNVISYNMKKITKLNTLITQRLL